MRLALFTSLLVAAIISLAAAQLCPDTPEGYTRQTRPADEPANYPPPEEPACYMRYTMSENSAASCHLCHYELWRTGRVG